MTNKILFSVIVPTYNRAHLISNTIESILSQTYTNFELHIIDDGSTDATEEVVQKYLSDKVFYHKKNNGERAVARNFGTRQSKGDYINWFDSDDIMFPNHLQQAAEAIEQLNTPEFFSTGFQYQTEAGVVFYRSNYSQNVNHDFHKGNPLSVDSVFVRKDIALQNAFNEDIELSGSEDYELWMRLAAMYQIHTIPMITTGFTHHNMRSTIVMRDTEKLINRYSKLLYYTTNDPKVKALLGENLSFFEMKTYLLLAVDLMNNNQGKLGVKYHVKGFKSSYKIIFERGFYAFIKHFLRHLLS